MATDMQTLQLIKESATQIAATTIDLDQAAATYTLFTGKAASVLLEKLVFRVPDVDISGTPLTSISIQTDDFTPAVIISSADGDLANLGKEATISWTGALIIPPLTLIQLTIAGAATAVTCVCDVVVEARSITDAGYLA